MKSFLYVSLAAVLTLCLVAVLSNVFDMCPPHQGQQFYCLTAAEEEDRIGEALCFHTQERCLAAYQSFDEGVNPCLSALLVPNE